MQRVAAHAWRVPTAASGRQHSSRVPPAAAAPNGRYSRSGGQGAGNPRRPPPQQPQPAPPQERPPPSSLEELLPWQVYKLEQAVAVGGRRKVAVKQLAADLDVDRTLVLAWLKEFQARPTSVQQAIVTQRVDELKGGGGVARPTPDVNALRKKLASNLSQAKEQGVGQQEKGAGFVPFYVRRQQWQSAAPEKKLKADAIRTLEALYEKTKYPSDAMIRGLWDLHRIPRTAAIDWFKERRELSNAAKAASEPAEPIEPSRPGGSSSSSSSSSSSLQPVRGKGAAGRAAGEAMGVAAGRLDVAGGAGRGASKGAEKEEGERDGVESTSRMGDESTSAPHVPSEAAWRGEVASLSGPQAGQQQALANSLIPTGAASLIPAGAAGTRPPDLSSAAPPEPSAVSTFTDTSAAGLVVSATSSGSDSASTSGSDSASTSGSDSASASGSDSASMVVSASAATSGPDSAPASGADSASISGSDAALTSGAGQAPGSQSAQPGSPATSDEVLAASGTGALPPASARTAVVGGAGAGAGAAAAAAAGGAAVAGPAAITAAGSAAAPPAAPAPAAPVAAATAAPAAAAAPAPAAAAAAAPAAPVAVAAAAVAGASHEERVAKVSGALFSGLPSPRKVGESAKWAEIKASIQQEASQPDGGAAAGAGGVKEQLMELAGDMRAELSRRDLRLRVLEQSARAYMEAAQGFPVSQEARVWNRYRMKRGLPKRRRLNWVAWRTKWRREDVDLLQWLDTVDLSKL